jgi:hypothetical protein
VPFPILVSEALSRSAAVFSPCLQGCSWSWAAWAASGQSTPVCSSLYADGPAAVLAPLTAQYTAPDYGDGSYFLIIFTATDSQGLTAATIQQVDLKTLMVTLATSPSGGTVVYVGTSHPAPFAAKTIAATYVPGTFHTFFTIRRSAPGALLVKFTVVDDCGAWPTFIGAGPSAGW